MTDSGILPVVQAFDLADMEPHRRWLVESLWARAGVGIVGGAPKVGKSWLALDLALSVASNTPCLGRFAVHDPGPVLLYMAEDGPADVKQRLVGLCRTRGLDLASIPLGVVTTPSRPPCAWISTVTGSASTVPCASIVLVSSCSTPS